MEHSDPSARRRVVVTGMGCVSPLGEDSSEMAHSLREARDCVSPILGFDVSGCQGKTAGQVPDVWLDRACRDRNQPNAFNRAGRMLLKTICEAHAMHPGFVPELAVIGTTSGGMLLGEQFFRALQNKSVPREAARWVRSYVPQAPVLDAMQCLGWDAPCRILSNACASGTNAIGHAFSLVRSGRYRRVLCGGYDVLCQLVFAGFDALRAYTPERCRPFDAGRSGLVLGEGAAVFFLESMDDAIAAGRPQFAEVTRDGCSTHNHHQTSQVLEPCSGFQYWSTIIPHWPGSWAGSISVRFYHA
ncbi:MAG: beta-ketoacyl synthase N-terminal-like domain-containing protein, partial [Chthoniobacterales bacterium]